MIVQLVTMTTKANAVRVVDKRIEPQPPPVYAETVGPIQSQYYKIPASGLSDSYITFNNMTTLGPDRAYLDTFELQLEVEISFQMRQHFGTQIFAQGPNERLWTLDSFPFNKCCEEVRVNVNGGSFFSSPLSYVRAKERYWDEKALSDSYCNATPCHKPHIQNELGVCNPEASAYDSNLLEANMVPCSVVAPGGAQPTRYGGADIGYNRSASGVSSSSNNACFTPYSGIPDENGVVRLITTWREPIFASPFSSRIDATYGRPLYNITSMDIAFTLQDLGNMIRVSDPLVSSYRVHIRSANLCFQVLTVPPGIAPSVTDIPYRRIVPYITDYPQNPVPEARGIQTNKIHLTSGVFTWNVTPTAVYVFVGPTKAALQTNQRDGFGDVIPNPGTSYITEPGVSLFRDHNTWGHNKGFGFLDHISISLANTTQILNTAEPLDLYRIAKANGCQDSWEEWGRVRPFKHNYVTLGADQAPGPFDVDRVGRFDPQWLGCSEVSGDVRSTWTDPYYRMSLAPGMGSVLRLIPGTDIILPDKQLIPGSNADNMVFQVEVDATLPALPNNYRDVALWVLFEYVGVATIKNGECFITTNPLGDNPTLTNAPVVSAAQVEGTPPASVEGSGWLDTIKDWFGKANEAAKKTGIIGNLLNFVPTVGPMLSQAAKTLGYGEMGKKRPRQTVAGGAVMGLGDFT